MTFHPVPLTTEVVFRGDHEGDDRVSVLHYRRSPSNPAPSEGDLVSLCAWMRDNVLFYLAGCCSNLTRWNEITATNIDTADGARGSLALSPIMTGARTGDPLPGNVQSAMSKHTTSHQHGGLGRIFVPDLSETDQNDAVIGNALQSLLLSLGARLLEHAIAGTSPSSQNLVPVVASKVHGTTADIQAVTFDTYTDSLYPRLKGKRRHRRRPATP